MPTPEIIADLCTAFQLQSRTQDLGLFLHHKLGGPPHQGDGTAYENYYKNKARLLHAMQKHLQAEEVTRLEAEKASLEARVATLTARLWDHGISPDPKPPVGDSKCPLCGAPGEGDEDSGAWDCGRGRAVEGQFFEPCPEAERVAMTLQRENKLLREELDHIKNPPTFTLACLDTGMPEFHCTNFVELVTLLAGFCWKDSGVKRIALTIQHKATKTDDDPSCPSCP